MTGVTGFWLLFCGLFPLPDSPGASASLCSKERWVLMGPLACRELFLHLNKGDTTFLTCSQGLLGGSG